MSNICVIYYITLYVDDSVTISHCDINWRSYMSFIWTARHTQTYTTSSELLHPPV